MTLCTRMVGGQNLQFHAELFKFSPQMIDKYPGGISTKPWEGGCENQNSHDLSERKPTVYLRSLLYSMSNHMPKKRLCSPLTRVKTKAMALILGMAP